MNGPKNAHEKIKTLVCEDRHEASVRVAGEMIDLIRQRNEVSGRIVFGLATGFTPVLVYQHLIEAHRKEGISFKNVVTFNLDEYWGLSRNHPESYWHFMHEQLFNHVDIAPENIHIPDGEVPEDEVFDYCRNYERQIEQAGGLDIQILGIGRTGHIGFNEPDSAEDSLTRLVTLDPLTLKDAADNFGGIDAVPKKAITMGIKTILQSRKIFLMAFGQAKSEIVAQAVRVDPTASLPASFLQLHQDATFYIDREAAADLD